MKVKPLHNYKLYGTSFLRYQFIGKSGNPIDLAKIENLKVHILYKGEYIDISHEVQKIFPSKTISVFISMKEVFKNKSNFVARVVISWNYKNSTIRQEFTDSIKVVNDNSLNDWRQKRNKLENKRKKGKGGKRSEKSLSKKEKEEIGIYLF